MPSDFPPDADVGRVTTLFAEYVAARATGRLVDFEALCRAHPAEAGALRQALEKWEKAQPALSPHIVTIDGAISAEVAAQGPVSSGLLDRLAIQPSGSGHYRLDGEIARGGMGVILKVWDENLRRHLAMKVILAGEDSPDGKTLARFLEEAQVTGQLDHPGIVPVHELGVDADGRLFFTMKLVKGRDLKCIFDLVHAGAEGWNETRALSVILKVCEAMAFAHAKGVLHRDLKPANVMVGNFGEVYVMDWGLARVLGHKDSHDIRIKPEFTLGLTSIRTERRDKREETNDSPILTMGGDVVGTPAYMSPEQAFGEVDHLSPQSDVYAIGAMLYHLLARHMPYVGRGQRITSRTILAMVLQGPPAPLTSQRKSLPAELVSICEKAMAREQSARYADTLALAEDLRAYLERRVVKAYETGAAAELKKWVLRNKGLAVAMLGVFALAVVVAIVERNGRRKADREREIAQEYAERVSVLSDTALVIQLENEAQELWPIHPRTVPALEEWLARARDVDGRAQKHMSKLVALRAQALPYTEEDQRADSERDPLMEKLQDHESDRRLRVDDLVNHAEGSDKHARTLEAIEVWDGRIAALKPRVGSRRTWRFADPAIQHEHDALAILEEALKASLDTDPSQGRIADVEQRLARSRTIAARSVDEHQTAWETVRALIADRTECPLYDGLVLAAQVGLVPLGRDPDSGLFEFAVLETGDVPERGPDARLILTDTMAIVLTLLPGGETTHGAQKTDRNGEGYEASAEENESPVRALVLQPFFASKYEVTQFQWELLGGKRPSWFDYHSVLESPLFTLRHPVESISWTEARDTLARLDLLLPTEAQWEYFARAWTMTPWFSGPMPDTLVGFANLPDKTALDFGAKWVELAPWGRIEDGFVYTAPVGSYRPNAFGLHDVCGNVSEWCRDGTGSYGGEFGAGDCYRTGQVSKMRVVRGGAYDGPPLSQRSAKREFRAPTNPEVWIGVRPVRSIEH